MLSVGHHRRPCAGAALFLGQEDRFVKAGETVHRGFPRGEVGVCADEPGQRPLHLAEGIGDLHQAAKLDRAREIARRAHNERKYDGGLAVTDGEKGQELLPLHDRPPVVHHRSETGAEAAQFIFLAVIERYALAVLAEAHQVEAEVRLVFLLVEVERDERFADLVGEPGSRRWRRRSPPKPYNRR